MPTRDGPRKQEPVAVHMQPKPKMNKELPVQQGKRQ